MSKEGVSFVIECDGTELEAGVAKSEQLLGRLDVRTAQSQQRLDQLAKEVAKQERAILQQYQSVVGIVSTSFGIIRNLMQVFGWSMTAVESATMMMFETLIRSLVSMQRAVSLARLGALGPGGLALAGVQIAGTITASVMMVAAQAQARQEFAEIRTRVQSGVSLLEVASRNL